MKVRTMEIVETLKKHPNITDRELSRIMDFFDPNKVRPRRNELTKKGIVIPVGKKVCTITGKTSICWNLENGFPSEMEF